MASRPTKRQKRLVMPGLQRREKSEKKDDFTISATSGRTEAALAPTQARIAQHDGTGHRSPPSKSTGKAKKASKKQNTSKGIHSFFNAVTQTQNASPNQVHGDVQEENDCIEDETMDSAPLATTKYKNSPSKAPSNSSQSSVKKRSESFGHNRAATRVASRKRFALRNDNASKAKISGRTFPASWLEAFPAENVSELAIHHKKVSAIRDWLQQAFHDKGDKNLLVLKGPAGCGKSAAVRTIAESLRIQITEWNNPTGYDYASEGYVSLAAQFEEFIGRNSRYRALEMSGLEGINQGKAARPTNFETQNGGLLLIEDFPNIFTSSSSTLLNFRSSLLRFLAMAGTHSGRDFDKVEGVTGSTSIIMLVVEMPGSTSKAASDSFTARKLLGSDIIHHPATTVIEMNPVAPTLITKALNCLLKKQGRQSGKPWIPDPDLMERLSQLGDIRNAVNALEFAYMTQDDCEDSNAKKMPAKLVSSKGSTAAAVDIVQREFFVDIFHAVGKVVYNKRMDNQVSNDLANQQPQPPAHLSHLARPYESEVSSEELMNNVGVDVETFVAALHENFVLSCSGEGFVDSFNDCMEDLSAADLINSSYSTTPTQAIFRKHNGNDNTSTLRQDELSFHTAVRGLLFSLPYPVKRGSSGTDTKRTRDPFKMLYPQSLRIWKRVSDAETVIESWSNAVILGANSTKAAITSEPGLAFTANQSAEKMKESTNESGSMTISQELILPCNRLDRRDMILDYLPYVHKIGPQPLAASAMHDLQGLVTFSTSTGCKFDGKSQLDDDEEVFKEESAERPRMQDLLNTAVSLQDKLVLSDDDIVDD